MREKRVKSKSWKWLWKRRQGYPGENIRTTNLWSEYYNAFHSVAYNHLFYFPWVQILSLSSRQCQYCKVKKKEAAGKINKYAQFLFLDFKFVSVKSGHVSGSPPYNIFRKKKNPVQNQEKSSFLWCAPNKLIRNFIRLWVNDSIHVEDINFKDFTRKLLDFYLG